MVSISKIFILLLSFFLFSCHHTTEINFEKEKQEILMLDEQAREFHFTKNAKAMADGFSNTFISINRGVISQPTYDQSFQRFDNYFKQVEFIKWDNNQPPIVRFSEDASIAYVAVDKSVILKTKDETDKEIVDTTYFAWLSVFRKADGKWILDCVSSTNK